MTVSKEAKKCKTNKCSINLKIAFRQTNLRPDKTVSYRTRRKGIAEELKSKSPFIHQVNTHTHTQTINTQLLWHCLVLYSCCCCCCKHVHHCTIVRLQSFKLISMHYLFSFLTETQQMPTVYRVGYLLLPRCPLSICYCH